MTKSENSRFFRVVKRDYAGKIVPLEVVERAEGVVHSLEHQPYVSITGRESVQIEYEKDNGDYLEFEFFEHYTAMFVVIDDEEVDMAVSTYAIPFYVSIFLFYPEFMEAVLRYRYKEYGGKKYFVPEDKEIEFATDVSMVASGSSSIQEFIEKYKDYEEGKY